ncbi:carbohydrate ABC transporter permease [Micromonospora echinofusca]|uniref:ABC transporter permease subunit n=1 Tax=Micromonospora echinofusca TaxID=47858 RepID=A0ABS3VLT2_MICEH|nr:sugar ABC transporter permease [Micromonospora echinofusca]MBO4205494.1 ABC transporter permease subunit [Micromonospora echinofusca]
MSTAEKFLEMFIAIGIFVAVVGVILFFAGRIGGRRGDRWVAFLYLAPAILMLAVGLIYPAARTIYQSFFDAAGTAFIGLDNYQTIFTSRDQLTVLRNTVLWVVVTPFVATAVGLLYAILVDKARLESFAKALIFLPMAISFVGASIIWKFVYEFRPDQVGVKQIGLLNQILVWLGGKPQQWLVESPWNTLFLILVMIWIQAGFAMTVLSAAIKAIPDDVVEAARLDGVTPFGMFRFVTLPSIRPAVVVVLTTIGIGTLKVFDIVRTMTGGQFDTSVVANEFYSQSFRSDNQGLGAALAVLLFVLVIPIVVYNVRQLRASEAR